jgi:alkylation response protein AidB-like acyl-CoA dehydrogenase
MNFELSEEQAMLRDMLQRFAADRHGAEQRRAWRALPHGFSPGNRATLAELGILALPIPADRGGLGGTLVDIIVVMEALGHGLVADPVLIPDMLASPILAELFGPGSPCDLVALAHSYTRDPAHIDAKGRLSGSKNFVPYADAANTLLVTCMRASDPVICLVPNDAPGVVREDRRLVDGSHASTIRFEGVEVPADRCLPCSPELLADAIRKASVAASAEMLGIMQRLFDTTRDYVRTRHQFGAPIGSFQAVRHRMARLFILVEQARSLVLKAALTPTEDAAWPRAVESCRMYLEDASIDLAHGCVQLHGGMGITDEIDITEGHKRLLVLRRLFSADGPYPLPAVATSLMKAA